MKYLRNPLMVLSAILLILSLGLNGQASLAALVTPTPKAVLPTPGAGGPPVDSSIPALTEGQPIHMPDLLGQSLDYATSIWDTDEELPQIRVVGQANDPSLVIVGQQPAPGTLIVPSQATIVLTLGKAPVKRPAPSPTPSPRLATAAAGQATLLRSPYVQNLKTNAVTIVWTTVEDAASEVDYGMNDFSLTVAATSTYFTTPAAAPYDQYYVHQATLSNLSPDTVYQYKIFTNSVNLTPGGSASFRTAKPSTASSFRLAVFGDSGDGSQNQKDVATRLLQVQPDLALHAGDIIYPEANYSLFETNYFQPYSTLLKSVWVAPAMGNHDVTYNNGKSFTDVYVNPPNAAKASDQELYYSFDYGNAHFTVLNNYFSMTTIGSAQYNWMVNDLATTNQFWKFVIFHQPPYTTDTNQLPKDNSAIVNNLVPLFEKYNVDMVFGGHWHYYERMYPMLGGKVSTIAAGGVVYVVTGGGGAGLGSIGTGALNPRTAAKFKKFHLTMIDVQGCSLQLSAVQKVSGSTDTFDSSDIFDTYTLNRCSEPASTSTPSPTPALTSTPTSTPTAGPTATFTPTPTYTSTPGPTATPSSTPTAIDTSTPTPTSAVTDAIFADGFESGTLSAWSGSATNSGKLSVSSAAALAGSYGLQAQISGTTAMYVSDASPNAESRYRARFYFDPNSIAMASGDYMYILQAYTGSSTGILRLEFKNSSGMYQVRARVYNNSGTLVSTPYATISDGPHSLEIDWAAASASGVADGSLAFWVDGVQQGSITAIANDTHRLESIRLGMPYSAAAGTSGTLYFDAFESRRQTYIGP